MYVTKTVHAKALSNLPGKFLLLLITSGDATDKMHFLMSGYAPSHRGTTLVQCYRRNEQEKKRAYEERVREVEHGSFSPLIFSTSGGMGPIATVVYKRIATLIAEKRDQPYSRTLFWIRCKLSFSLLRSAIMCIRGSRSSYHHPAGMIGEAIALTCSEGRIVSLR